MDLISLVAEFLGTWYGMWMAMIAMFTVLTVVTVVVGINVGLWLCNGIVWLVYVLARGIVLGVRAALRK